MKKSTIRADLIIQFHSLMVTQLRQQGWWVHASSRWVKSEYSHDYILTMLAHQDSEVKVLILLYTAPRLLFRVGDRDPLIYEVLSFKIRDQPRLPELLNKTAELFQEIRVMNRNTVLTKLENHEY